MLPLLLLAVAAEAPAAPSPRVSAAQPAQAVVRIVRGAAIHFSEAKRFEGSVARDGTVRERDGSVRTASLIEFY
ncbi:MAG TPA: hypothetical protein VFR52_01605 [Sphingomicrobium sp.]|nr:hypothetical protein [Sphingomicrobium sp.]